MASILGDRDFFGDCCNAAKKRGLHVLARMSPDLEWEEALEPHPEWFERNAQGEPVAHTEEPKLYRTCMFTDLFHRAHSCDHARSELPL